MAQRSLKMSRSLATALTTCIVLGVATATGIFYYIRRKRNNSESTISSNSADENIKVETNGAINSEKKTSSTVKSNCNGDSLHALKDLSEDEKENMNSNDMYAELKLQGNILFKENQFSQAIEKYLMSLDYCMGKSDNELRAISYQNISAAYEAMGQYDDAIEYCEKSINANPDYVKAITRMGTLKSKTGHHNEAVEYFWQVLKGNNHAPIQTKFEESLKIIAEEKLKSLLDTKEKIFVSNFVLKRYYAGILRDPIIVAAKDVADETASESGLCIDDEDSSDSLTSNELFNKRSMTNILRLVKNNKFSDAYEMAENLLKNSFEMFSLSNQALLLNFLGTVEFAMGYVEESFQKFNKIIELNENNILDADLLCVTELKLIGVELSFAMTDLDSIKSHTERLIQDFPNHPDVYLNLYQLNLMTKSTTNGSDLLEKANNLSSNHPFCQLQIIYNSIRNFQSPDLADLYELMENLKKIGLNKTSGVNSIALSIYLETLLQMGQYDMALQNINEILNSSDSQQDPDPYVYCLAGEIYYSLGNMNECLLQSNAALKIDPYFDKAHHLKITSHSALFGDNLSEIKIMVDTFTKFCPRSPLLSETYQMIKYLELKSKYPISE